MCIRDRFKAVPSGFVPGQDKQYLVGFAQLPDAATLDRTEDVIRRMDEIALKHPGVENAISFPGLSINGFTNSSNSGIVFVGLKPFDPVSYTHLDVYKGQVRVRARLDNPDGKLMPGQFVRVQLGQAKAEQQLVINERAVGTDQNKNCLLYTSRCV